MPTMYCAKGKVVCILLIWGKLLTEYMKCVAVGTVGKHKWVARAVISLYEGSNKKILDDSELSVELNSGSTISAYSCCRCYH